MLKSTEAFSAAISRLEVLFPRTHLAIVSDYPFSGSGLAVSEMVYSSYLFMVQVPFTAQAHNLFLQVARRAARVDWICWFAFGAFGHGANTCRTRHRIASPQREIERMIALLVAATVGSLVTLAVNGMLDADIYSGYLVSLVFVPVLGGLGTLPRP